MSLKKILPMAIVLTLTSCGGVQKQIVNKNHFEKEYVLSVDSVPTQRIYDNLFLTLADGHLIVSSFKANPMMHFYTTPDLQYKFSAGTKGHGPREMQSFPTFCQSKDNRLYVRGYTANTLRQLEIGDSDISETQSYKIPLDDTPNDMFLVKDTCMYYANLDNASIKVFNIPRHKEQMTFSMNSLYDADSESLLGTLCVNDSLTVYGMQYSHEIVVLRTADLSYAKTILWNGGEQEEKQMDGKVWKKLYYTNAFATTSRFYFLCRGSFPHTKEARFSIEVYDKAMNSAIRYYLDKKLFKFVVDEENRYIYGLGENDDFIYRYKLPN